MRYPNIHPFISEYNKTQAWNHYLNGTGELIHFHARKAAGTAIVEWFEDIVRFNKKNPNQFRKFEAFSNWNKNGINPIISTMTDNGNSSLFSICLRHPIERILSHYDFEFRWGCNTCCHTNSDMLQQLNNNRDPDDMYPNLNASNYLVPMMVHEWWKIDGGCTSTTNSSKHKLCNIEIEDLVLRVQRFEINDGNESLLMKNQKYLARQQLIGGVYLYNYYLWMFCCRHKYCNLYKDFIQTGLIQKCFDDAVAKIKSMDIVILMEWLNDQRTSIYVNKMLLMEDDIKYRMKRLWYHEYPHKDKFRGRNYMINQKVYDKLMEWNKWDMKLYEFVKRLVYDRMKVVWDGDGKLIF